VSARRHLDGYTLQFGGPRSPCIRGLEDDPAWFARYHGRNHRIRQPIGGEVDSLAGGPPRFKPLVIVRQVEPGARIRVACWVRRQPLNSERPPPPSSPRLPMLRR
jgi:hypothetical protein